jgi:hypothetical protein
MRCASPMSAACVLGGQVRPTARSFARYASSVELAVAIAALLTRAAPAIIWPQLQLTHVNYCDIFPQLEPLSLLWPGS